MQGLIGPLKELAEFEELCKNKKKDVGMIRVCGCVNSQKSHMMYAIGDGCKYKVIACSSETKAKQIYEEYRFLDNNTYLYPAKDFLFYKADIRSKELVKQRMEGIQAVLSGTPVTIVTSLDGFMDHLAPKESIEKKVMKIDTTATVPNSVGVKTRDNIILKTVCIIMVEYFPTIVYRIAFFTERLFNII